MDAFLTPRRTHQMHQNVVSFSFRRNDVVPPRVSISGRAELLAEPLHVGPVDAGAEHIRIENAGGEFARAVGCDTERWIQTKERREVEEGGLGLCDAQLSLVIDVRRIVRKRRRSMDSLMNPNGKGVCKFCIH